MPATPRRYDLSCTVDPYRDGWTLREFLAHRFRYHPPETWDERLAAGAVRLRGALARGDERVRRGDRVEYVVWHAEPPVDFRFEVLAEDDHVLAVSKSGNLPVHAGGKYLSHTLIARLREERGPDLRLAHRLDRETSGIVLLAKTRDAARFLERQFRGRRVRKAYVAILRGALSAEVVADAPIARAEPAAPPYFRVVDPGGGKPARTRFVPVAVRDAAAGADASAARTWALALPEEGRTNQIRVHASHLGHPVLGDKIYGVTPETARRFVAEGDAPAIRAAAGAPRQLLHCARLVLPHPAGGELDLRADPPADFAESWGGPAPAFAVSWTQTPPPGSAAARLPGAAPPPGPTPAKDST